MSGRDVESPAMVCAALDGVILECIFQANFDVVGRACLLQARLLSSLVESGHMGDAVVDDCVPFDLDLASEVLREGAGSPVWDVLVDTRRSGFLEKKARNLSVCASFLERLAAASNQRCVCFESRASFLERPRSDPIRDRWVVATSPVRIDIAGGWSDTPPVCFEYGGAVTGIAVCVDGRRPLMCACRIVTGGSYIQLRSEIRDASTGEALSHHEALLTSGNDLKDFNNPQSECALIKSALLCLGLTTTENLYQQSDADLQQFVNAFCSSSTRVGLEIVATSLLPQGSGLGTSSILGGCVLAAIAQCVGIEIRDALSSPELLDAVLHLEQLMTTGGGYQDQVNGLVGGVKIVSSEAVKFPLQMKVDRIPLDPKFQKALDDRLVLVFTGKTRLAKNILQNVLQRWASRTPEICEAVSGLVGGAEKAKQALLSSDLDAFGSCLSEYWDLKKIMAGPSSGVEPDVVKEVITVLEERDCIRGASLCGAGGGGFLVMVAQDGTSSSDMRSVLEKSLPAYATELASFQWHECTVSNQGLMINVVDDASFGTNWFTLEGSPFWDHER